MERYDEPKLFILVWIQMNLEHSIRMFLCFNKIMWHKNMTFILKKTQEY